MTTCPARIRPFRGSGSDLADLEVACDVRYGDAEHYQHAGEVRDAAGPGSTSRILWLDDDRRNYRGDWPGPCPGADGRCTLPAGHPRRCAP